MWEWPTYVLSSHVFVFFSYVHLRYYRKKNKKTIQNLLTRHFIDHILDRNVTNVPYRSMVRILIPRQKISIFDA